MVPLEMAQATDKRHSGFNTLDLEFIRIIADVALLYFNNHCIIQKEVKYVFMGMIMPNVYKCQHRSLRETGNVIGKSYENIKVYVYFHFPTVGSDATRVSLACSEIKEEK